MADIRCPMCGKPNPDSRDTCQYCQARLKPLIASAPEEPKNPPSQPAGASDGGDWLSDFRTDDSEEPASGEEASSDSEDWFSRLDDSQTDEPEGGSQEEQALPDWLTGSTESQAPAEQQAEPDWLSGFAQTPSSTEETEEQETPGWLSGPAESQTPMEKESEPDWLDQFHQESIEDAGPGKPDEDRGVSGATDWLSGLGSLSEPSEESSDQTGLGDELPDWLSTADEPGTSQQASPLHEDALPDWMHEVGSEPVQEEPAEGEETGEAAALGEIPDWLSSQMPTTPQEEAPSPFTDASAQEEPDWFQDKTPADQPSSVPDWLTEASTSAQESLAPSGEPPAESAEEEIPADWFSSLGAPAEEGTVESTPAFVMGEEDLAPFVSGDDVTSAESTSGPLDSFPDWLSQVSEEKQPVSEPAPRSLTPSREPPPQSDAGLAPAELPTWLEAMRPVESAVPSSAASEEGPSKLETAGPLAGLRGILPAEAEIAHMRKPPVYSVKLQVSEAHQARVSLLEELIAAEGQPKPVAPHAVIVPQTALRLAIAVFLILAAIGAFWVNGDANPSWTTLPDPANIPPEVESLQMKIETLTSEAPVLIAFDYDPGFSDEMEAAASGVIARLIEKRVPLVFVSTNPLGPALAERMAKNQVDKLNSQLTEAPPYTTTLFTNLGYIPGTIAGLRAFAETPAKIIPISLNGEEIWDTAPLTPSTTLAGFSLSLVITDNPDTARAWIEQAGPFIKPSSLMMIISAQAEPLIRPYYDSGQVQGLMAGIVGGATYENKIGQNGLASQYWDAFSACLLVATILILIGGLVNAGLASMARNKRKGEEQPYA